MAISFPREAPSALKIAMESFKIKPMQQINPLRSGEILADDLGPTLWTAKYESTYLNEENFGIARSWFDTLTSIENFYGFDYLRIYPYLYRKTKWSGLVVTALSPDESFDGTCKLENVTDNKIVDLRLLPVGFGLSIGDYISFSYGAKPSRALHRVSTSAVADANGDLQIEVRPFIRVGWAEDATVNLFKPSAEMKILPETWEENAEASKAGFGKISFEAIQTL